MVSFNGWEIRACILFSLFLQIFLNVAGTFRRLASRRWIFKILWFAYLLAEFVAVFGLGLIVSRQSLLYNYYNDKSVEVHCMELEGHVYGTCKNDHILMYWATFFLVHLGGPDTITAFATEDNELWLRHLFYLSSKCITVAYAIYESVQTSYRVSIPILLMFLYGIIKCTERACALYYGSAKSFRNSMLSKNDSEINNIPKEEDKMINMNAGVLVHNHKEVLQYAFVFFTKFKGLFVDLSLGIHERNQSREFFLARSSEDAFRLVEVELNYLYDVLFTKIPVLHHKIGLCCRSISIISVVSSLVLFCFEFWLSQKIDAVVTYILFSGAIVSEVIAFYMLLFCDWTVVKLRPLSDAIPNGTSWKDKFLGCILSVNNTRSVFFLSCLRLIGDRDHHIEYKFTDSRWANSLSSFNLIFYCLHRCSEGREKLYTNLGLLRFLNWFLYVKPQPLTKFIASFIFNELKLKSERAGSLAVAKQICSSKGEWLLNELDEDHGAFLPYVTKYNYDEILLLWHIATELCYNDIQDQVTNKEQRDTAKHLSDYMLYLMVMKPDMMSGVSSIGEKKFRDTCTEVSKFFDAELPELKKRKFCNFYHKKSMEEMEALQRKACEKILKTDVELVTVHRDRNVFFTASVLAKKLKDLPSERKWLIISKLWVELLSYAATHVRSTAHAEQLTEGGELVTVVWLLMAHFGLGDQYEMDPGNEAWCE